MAAPKARRSFDDDAWSAEMADDFLHRNGGEDGTDVVPVPEIMSVIDRKAEEPFFLLESGIAGRGALMRRFPFGAIGTTPEAVFDRVGFFVDKDGTFEMHRVLGSKDMREQIRALPHMKFLPANNLYVHGKGWKDFQSMAGTLRAFSSVLRLTDARDDWDSPEAENARIRGVMKGLAAMASGTLLRDREPEARPVESPRRAAQKPSAATAGIHQIAAAIEQRPYPRASSSIGGARTPATRRASDPSRR